MKPIDRLGWDLHNASMNFERGMKRSIVKMNQYMNVQMHAIRELFPVSRKRQALKAKTIALINMDHDQIYETNSWELRKRAARASFEMSLEKPKPASAWFMGDTAERTYY